MLAYCAFAGAGVAVTRDNIDEIPASAHQKAKEQNFALQAYRINATLLLHWKSR